VIRILFQGKSDARFDEAKSGRWPSLCLPMLTETNCRIILIRRKPMSRVFRIQIGRSCPVADENSFVNPVQDHLLRKKNRAVSAWQIPQSLCFCRRPRATDKLSDNNFAALEKQRGFFDSTGKELKILCPFLRFVDILLVDDGTG